MKEFKVGMTRHLVELVARPIRSKNHIVKLLFEAIPLLTNGELIQETSTNYILLRIDKMKRLFFVIENKIFSFNFPFNVELNPEIINPIIYDAATNIKLDGINFAVLKTVYDEIFSEDDYKGILDLDSELMHIMETFECKPHKDEFWLILKRMLSFESGYLRYDYDEKHENGKMHPLNHLDINYSSDNTFKIGLSKNLNCDNFIDIIDINTDSYFIV
ncbi:hypothetical protein [Paenibacillus taichungensis]